ncbi:hypothetical protein PHJA_001106500 [Phtheirospermum japonicum]|uniref:Uncharacterized protein n=1 Tax=Phtheirospermum japonicum TaxID=374723 RepID=A0A830BPQ2_9LAMI|nr:hypothetical protein PHJA_001106500 [Phtheirospermum japonicum]
MEPEAVINLFDSSWFYPRFFESQLKFPIPEPNPNPQIQQKPSKLNVPRQLTIHTRSKSDQLVITNFSADVSAPKSQKPHLQTILSEKEINLLEVAEKPKIRKPRKELNRRKKRFSKSLSELEFEEVKGFMDLGFVFSEEDKEDSSLVEIVPGLQKLGLRVDCEELCGPRARPYLSEAWEVESPIMKWTLPAVGNEIDMKDNLKWWAHSVASAVR